MKRARDFKQKDQIVKKLSLKAQLRNPDEYYHKMAAMKVDAESGKAIKVQKANTPLEK